MLQFIGLVILLFVMAHQQLVWSLPLWGLQGPPLFMLITGLLVLWHRPRLTFYFVLLLLTICMDMMVGEGFYTAFATLVAAQIPFLHFWKRSQKTGANVGAFIPMLLCSIFVFESVLTTCFFVRYTGVWGIFTQGLLAELLWNLLLGMLLYFPVEFLLRLLHYQESDYLEDAMRGNLG